MERVRSSGRSWCSDPPRWRRSSGCCGAPVVAHRRGRPASAPRRRSDRPRPRRQPARLGRRRGAAARPVPRGRAGARRRGSAWVANYQRREPVEAAVAGLGLTSAAYLVVESVVDDYGTPARRAPVVAGRRALAGCAHRRPDPPAPRHGRGHLDPQLARGAVAGVGELQPRCRYVRNQVVRALTRRRGGRRHRRRGVALGRPHRRPDAVLRSRRRPAVLQANIERMLDTTAGCLDMDRFRTATMSEYLLRRRGAP